MSDEKDASRKSEDSSLKRVASEVVGVKQWKASKIGYLTGLGFIFGSASVIGASVTSAKSNLSLLWGGLTSGGRRSVPGLDDPESFRTAVERFEAAVRLQNISPTQLQRILKNTKRSGYFYIILFCVYLIIFSVTAYTIPASSFFVLIARLGPAALIFSLLFKSCFTNWSVRHRVSTKPIDYIRSMDWLPKD